MTQQNYLASRVINLRKRKGISQEALAESAGLNLRTIQRIEKGETEPRGDTLSRLADALNVSIEELSDWSLKEDKGYLQSLNLSGIIFLVFPVFGILVPLIIWLQKRNKIKGVEDLGRRLINYQITMTFILFLGFIFQIIMLTRAFDRISEAGDISPDIIAGDLKFSLGSYLLTGIFLNAYNILLVFINAINISRDKKVRYFPAIKFIRN